MAANVLRKLDSDILLLQEVRDYDVCERLAEAIKPHTYQIAICSAFKEPFHSLGMGSDSQRSAFSKISDECRGD
jgi:hypothetical protein